MRVNRNITLPPQRNKSDFGHVKEKKQKFVQAFVTETKNGSFWKTSEVIELSKKIFGKTNLMIWNGVAFRQTFRETQRQLDKDMY